MSTAAQKVMGLAPTQPPMHIPQLLTNGANWVLYKRRIKFALQTKPNLQRHLEGMEPTPMPPKPLSDKATNDEKKAYKEALSEYLTTKDEWTASNGSVIQQIISTIPDTVFIQIQHLKTVGAMWAALKKDFEGHTQAVQNELHNQLVNTKCSENKSVRDHLDRMQYMYSELAGMGVPVPDKEYSTWLVQSMPKLYRSFFANVQSTSDITGIPLTPTIIVTQAVSEYDSRQLKNQPKHGSAPTRDQVLYFFAPNSGHSSGQCGKCGEKKDNKCTCFNCGEAGHFKHDCKKPKKDADNSKGSSSGGASQGTNAGLGKAPAQSVSIAEVKEDALPLKDGYLAVAFVGYTGDTQGAILVSGCTTHISPYRDLFTNYTPIDSIPITAANQTSFQAVGRGNIQMTWPNGSHSMHITLWNVLHCLGIVFTLVLMSVMDCTRYMFALKGG